MTSFSLELLQVIVPIEVSIGHIVLALIFESPVFLIFIVTVHDVEFPAAISKKEITLVSPAGYQEEGAWTVQEKKQQIAAVMKIATTIDLVIFSPARIGKIFLWV